MSIIEQILARRSARSYNGQPVPEEQLEEILAAGLAAPTGRGIHPVHLMPVTDPGLLAQLPACRQGGAAGMIAQAGAAVVVFADTSTSDTWIEDCSLAMGQMHLAASALGLGSCWVQGRNRTAADGRTTQDWVLQLLGIPAGFELEAILAIGVQEQLPPARTVSQLDASKVHRSGF